jgi:hypothetical protein
LHLELSSCLPDWVRHRHVIEEGKIGSIIARAEERRRACCCTDWISVKSR